MTETSFSVGNPASTLVQFGEGLAEILGDLAKGLLTPQLLDPRVVLGLTGNPVERTTEALRIFLSGGNLLTSAGEILNKSEIFLLVPGVSGLIGVPKEPPLPLPQLVANAYALGPFFSLWAIEGLGHDYGDSYWQQGVVPHHILSPQTTRDLPSGSLPMLHAGVGLSIAQTVLGKLEWNTPPQEVAKLVAEVVRLDRDNSLPGYAGAAYESLGLVSRTLHPTLVPVIDQAVREVAPEQRGFFWHGVGRAIYFWIVNFLPCSDWQVFEMAASEAPDAAARLNAWAGATWGYLLVNQRQPRIMADLLIKPFGDRLVGDDGFVNGVQSSLMMRFDTTPDAPFIETFLGYRPDPADRRLCALWEQLVRIPGETALADYYPVIKKHRRIGAIFEYRDLAAFVAGLGRRAA